MEIIINYWALLGVSVLSFIIGAVWYTPLMFGNIWMKIMGGRDKYTKEEMEKLQKEMTKFYFLQLLLTFITMFVLYMNVIWQAKDAGMYLAFFMWLGYVMPTQVAGVIWGNTEKKYWCKQISIMLGCQLVIMLLAGYIFSNL